MLKFSKKILLNVPIVNNNHQLFKSKFKQIVYLPSVTQSLSMYMVKNSVFAKMWINVLITFKLTILEKSLINENSILLAAWQNAIGESALIKCELFKIVNEWARQLIHKNARLLVPKRRRRDRHFAHPPRRSRPEDPRRLQDTQRVEGPHGQYGMITMFASNVCRLITSLFISRCHSRSPGNERRQRENRGRSPAHPP